MACALKWSYRQIDDLTLPEVYALYAYWREFPPENELAALQLGFGQELTFEEKIARGAMGPADFLKNVRKTGKPYVHKMPAGKN